ncbi:hypothetical protein PsorP6_012734 [Peronosclerospora sorghi]|uniref:Uncharacterized protein n=1 Tax=Peronosclerospora sorghi TaxID=230839 RepID=A0ACC0WGX5_9STRA|nr:hypothetical protein PsorP6_012734 [Peronosclerospora sorghi]
MSPSRIRRQSLGEEDTIDSNLDVIEVQEDDNADIALLSKGEPLVFSRSRACTTSSTSTSSRQSNIINPLSRLAMRRIEQPSDEKSVKTMPTFSNTYNQAAKSHLSGVLLHKKGIQSQPESEEVSQKEDTNSEIEDDDESHFTAQDYGDH